MHVIYVKRWDVTMVRSFPKTLFVFGDNLVGRGCGGQAIIRYEPNAIGIPTKKAPTSSSAAYFTDQEFDSNAQAIDTAIRHLEETAQAYNTIALPTDGLGTGLADLPRRAPRTYRYLQQQMKSFIDRIQLKQSH